VVFFVCKKYPVSRRTVKISARLLLLLIERGGRICVREKQRQNARCDTRVRVHRRYLAVIVEVAFCDRELLVLSVVKSPKKLVEDTLMRLAGRFHFRPVVQRVQETRAELQ